MENLESQKAEREMFKALKARKEALEEALRSKLEELKLLCFQEGVRNWIWFAFWKGQRAFTAMLQTN